MKIGHEKMGRGSNVPRPERTKTPDRKTLDDDQNVPLANYSTREQKSGLLDVDLSQQSPQSIHKQDLGNVGASSFGIGVTGSVGLGPVEIARLGITYVEGASWELIDVSELPEGARLIARNANSSIVAVWTLPDGSVANERADGSVMVFDSDARLYTDVGVATVLPEDQQPGNWRAGIGGTVDIIFFNGAASEYDGAFNTYGAGLFYFGISVSYTPESDGFFDFASLNLHVGPQVQVFAERAYFIDVTHASSDPGSMVAYRGVSRSDFDADPLYNFTSYEVLSQSRGYRNGLSEYYGYDPRFIEEGRFYQLLGESQVGATIGPPDYNLGFDPDRIGPQPIVLDLNANGVEVTELSASSHFVDATGDGLQNRTAWAAAGDGVLFYEPNNTGEITETRQYVFTEWDPTAESDLAAFSGRTPNLGRMPPPTLPLRRSLR